MQFESGLLQELYIRASVVAGGLTFQSEPGAVRFESPQEGRKSWKIQLCSVT